MYPGSFNPPTTAHLAIARAAIDAHGLDRVDLTVSRSALAKETVDHPRFAHRIEVLRATVADDPSLGVVVTEAQLLVEIASGYDLLIVGADKWWQIQDPVWYGGDPAARDAAMTALPSVAVVGRDDMAVPPELLLDVHDRLVSGVSSTRARSGDVSMMTPAARAFAADTGAWTDEARYDRWLATSADTSSTI